MNIKISNKTNYKKYKLQKIQITKNTNYKKYKLQKIQTKNKTKNLYLSSYTISINIMDKSHMNSDN